MSALLSRAASALGLVILLFLGPAAPAAAETPEARSPDTLVAMYVAALDAHDAERATDLLADAPLVVGTATAVGRVQVHAWIQNQINQGVVVEVGPLHVNGSRVTWTSRIDRRDWIGDGPRVRYVDEEAAIVGGRIAVLGSHFRPADAAVDDIPFVRARTLDLNRDPIVRPTAAPIVVALVIGLGLLAGTAAAGVRAVHPADTAPRGPRQQGRLLLALATAVAARHPPPTA
jgi:hypothetical protein